MTTAASLALLVAGTASAACAGRASRQIEVGQSSGGSGTPQAVAAAPAQPALQAAPEPDVFSGTVQPLLARTCTPCHVPGGRMYDRLPFDDPDTVRANKDGILRRLKAPEDREVLERWLASRGAQE